MQRTAKVAQTQQNREELLEDAKSLNDEKLLLDVLAFEDLEETEKTAFRNMHERLTGRRSTSLSPRQREWLENVYVKIGLVAEDTGALNLVSSGKVPRGNVPVFGWELNRPLKPPGK